MLPGPRRKTERQRAFQRLVNHSPRLYIRGFHWAKPRLSVDYTPSRGGTLAAWTAACQSPNAPGTTKRPPLKKEQTGARPAREGDQPHYRTGSEIRCPNSIESTKGRRLKCSRRDSNPRPPP